jgi:hypothetical protein
MRHQILIAAARKEATSKDTGNAASSAIEHGPESSATVGESCATKEARAPDKYRN